MRNLEALTRSLIGAASPAALSRAYDGYIRAVVNSRLWSADCPEGLRIPWRSAREASADITLRNAFRLPGLYLFGSAAGVPLYLGMTRGQLWRRLRGRYVQGARSQCQLAADYQPELCARGLEGFPEEVRVWYRHSFRGSTVRLDGAVAFARQGIEGIWFSLVPVSEVARVRLLEQHLIPIANQWNRAHDYPALLNAQDV